MKRAVKDLFLIVKLQERAKRNAKNGNTGTASCDIVTVAYYPRCGRFDWFDDNGIKISKRLAVKLLETHGKLF